MTDMTQAPTPGPLSADDVKLLVKGDWLLPTLSGAMPKQFNHVGSTVRDTPLLFFVDGGSCLASVANFIGRPDADGWIPWSGGDNPVPRQMVEVRFRNGVKWRVDPSESFIWPHGYKSILADKGGDIIAFRLAPTAPVEDVSTKSSETNTSAERVKETAENEHVAAPVEASGSERVDLLDLDNIAESLSSVGRITDGNTVIAAAVELGRHRDALRPQPSGETREATWTYCPECGSDEVGHEEGDHKQCGGCGQEWFSDLDYSDVVQKNLARLSARPAPVASGGQHGSATDFPPDDVLACVPVAETAGEGFQPRVHQWLLDCFGWEIAGDRQERGDRLLEEVLELLQSGRYDSARVAALRDYVWGRPVGEPAQEVGGVMVTLAAYCVAHDLDMMGAGETELARILQPEIVKKIRAKQAAKPTGSALPIAVPAQDDDKLREELERMVTFADALCSAADCYGVKHLDSDDMDDEAFELQASTLAMRHVLSDALAALKSTAAQGGGEG